MKINMRINTKTETKTDLKKINKINIIKAKNSAGISLIELLVAVAILAVLTGIIAPTLISHIEKARRSRDMANARQIEKVLTTALVEDNIYIPEGLYNYGYGAWVMMCRNDKSNAPEPYHGRDFTGGFCGVDIGVSINGTTYNNDTTHNTELADILMEHGIDVSQLSTKSSGNSKGWDWIIIEVCYDTNGKLCSRIYSGYKNENGGINRTPTSNIERLIY